MARLHRQKRRCSTLNTDAAARRHERSPRTESSKTSGMMTIGAKGDDKQVWRGRANVDCIVTHDRENRDLVVHDSGTRLADTCGTRDESPSSNLGSGKQGEAIRADVMVLQVGGRGPQ